MQKLKLDENGVVVVQDGKPIYLDADGKELAADVPAMYQKIIDLGKEAKKHRESSETFAETLKLFDGIEDLPAWKEEAVKAIETVANLNDKDWMKAEKVESLKRQMKEAHEQEVVNLKASYDNKGKEQEAIISKQKGQIRQLLVSAKFASSPLFSGDSPKTTLSPDIAESFFGKNFSVEEIDGELVVRAYYNNGDLIYSRENPGEPASFEEGIMEVFEKYPGKDKYLKSAQSSGSGAGGGTRTGEPETDIQKLEKQYKEAIDKKQTGLAITIKNRLHEARMKARGRAA